MTRPGWPWYLTYHRVAGVWRSKGFVTMTSVPGRSGLDTAGIARQAAARAHLLHHLDVEGGDPAGSVVRAAAAGASLCVFVPSPGQLVEGVVVDAHAVERGEGGHGHGADDGDEFGVSGRVWLACRGRLPDQPEGDRVCHPFVQGRVGGDRGGDRRRGDGDDFGQLYVPGVPADLDREVARFDNPSAEQIGPEREVTLVECDCHAAGFAGFEADLAESSELSDRPGDRGFEVPDVDLDN